MQKITLRISFGNEKKRVTLRDLKINFSDFKNLLVFKSPLPDMFICQIPESFCIPKIESFFNDETLTYFINSYVRLNSDKQEAITIKEVDELPEYNLQVKQIKEIFIEELEKNLEGLKQNLIDKIKLYEPEKSLSDPNIQQNTEHKNITCRVCFLQNIKGPRYVCSECDNFNICHSCFTSNRHNPEHFCLKFNKPCDTSINEYKSVLMENNIVKTLMLSKREDYVTFEMTFYNLAENSWKNCFLSPIAFGSNYLSEDKITIEEDINQNEILTKLIRLKVNKEGDYETKWRLFCENGLPFGEVFQGTVFVRKAN